MRPCRSATASSPDPVIEVMALSAVSGNRPSPASARRSLFKVAAGCAWWTIPIVGWNANEDGKTASLTLPSGERQAAVIRRTLKQACVAPEQVVYVEAHVTGTAAGDPIEATAIATAVGGHLRLPFCASLLSDGRSKRRRGRTADTA